MTITGAGLALFNAVICRSSSLNLCVSWSLEGLAPIKLGLQLAYLISYSALVNLGLL
jgi:hypothetical protein